MAEDDAARIERLEGEIARLRQLVADYAAEAGRLRQDDQSRAREAGRARIRALTDEEAAFAFDMGKVEPKAKRRRSA